MKSHSYYLINIPPTGKWLIVNEIDFTGGTYQKINVQKVERLVLKLKDPIDEINNKNIMDGGTWLYIQHYNGEERVVVPEEVEG